MHQRHLRSRPRRVDIQLIRNDVIGSVDTANNLPRSHNSYIALFAPANLPTVLLVRVDGRPLRTAPATLATTWPQYLYCLHYWENIVSLQQSYQHNLKVKKYWYDIIREINIKINFTSFYVIIIIYFFSKIINYYYMYIVVVFIKKWITFYTDSKNII